MYKEYVFVFSFVSRITSFNISIVTQQCLSPSRNSTKCLHTFTNWAQLIRLHVNELRNNGMYLGMFVSKTYAAGGQAGSGRITVRQ